LRQAKTILSAKTADFPNPAERPLFSALDCSKFERAFDLRLPDWKEALRLAMGSW
jgi:dTDP-4-dehydrorhamnose reductase